MYTLSSDGTTIASSDTSLFLPIRIPVNDPLSINLINWFEQKEDVASALSQIHME